MTEEKKTKRIWDNYKVVSEVQKNHRLKFVIAAGTRDGYRCVVIREFYLRKADGEWRPGRDGIILPLVAPIQEGDEITFIKVCQEAIKALSNCMVEAATMELADPENAIWQ